MREAFKSLAGMASHPSFPLIVAALVFAPVMLDQQFYLTSAGLVLFVVMTVLAYRGDQTSWWAELRLFAVAVACTVLLYYGEAPNFGVFWVVSLVASVLLATGLVCRLVGALRAP